jgi:drug/metabolite transporter (DMT)-like permease
MKYKAWIFLLLVNLFWSGNFIFGKFVINEFTPLWITFLRWLISILILFPLASFYEKANYKDILKTSWLQLSLMGLFGGVLVNIFTYSALEYTSPTNVALVSALCPAVTMIFSFFLLKEKVSRLQLLGFIISLIGVVIILTNGNILKIFHTQYNVGDLLAIVAVLSWSIYTIICKKSSNIPPITTTALSSLMGVLIMIPFVIAQPVAFYKVTLLGITGILYISIFTSVCAFILFNISVRIVGANAASMSWNLVPIYTAIITILLGQPLYSSQIWGGLIALTGLLLTKPAAKNDEEKSELDSKQIVLATNSRHENE